MIFGNELPYSINNPIRKTCLSDFEEYILLAVHKKKYCNGKQLTTELKNFLCTTAQYNTDECLKPNKLTAEKINSLFENNILMPGDLVSDDEDMGTPYRLRDYFPIQSLNLYLECSDKEQRAQVEGGILNLIPFFHSCRSDYYVKNVSNYVIQGIFVPQLERNKYKGKKYPFWFITNYQYYKSRHLDSMVKLILQMACYAFMWYRLKNRVPKDADYNKIEQMAKQIIQELLECQNEDGSWPSSSDETQGSIYTTCMVVHALSLCRDYDVSNVLSKAGEWLKEKWLTFDQFEESPSYVCTWIDSIALCTGEYEKVSFKVLNNKPQADPTKETINKLEKQIDSLAALAKESKKKQEQYQTEQNKTFSDLLLGQTELYESVSEIAEKVDMATEKVNDSMHIQEQYHVKQQEETKEIKKGQEEIKEGIQVATKTIDSLKKDIQNTQQNILAKIEAAKNEFKEDDSVLTQLTDLSESVKKLDKKGLEKATGGWLGAAGSVASIVSLFQMILKLIGFIS